MKRGMSWQAFVVFVLGFTAAAPMSEGRSGELEVTRLEQAFAAAAPLETLFAEPFLAAIPARSLRGMLDGLRAKYGPVRIVRREAARYLLETTTHSIPVEITLNKDGLIAGLMIKPAEPLTASIEDTLSALAQLPGEVSYLVRGRSGAMFERSSDRLMAVGSAFKLGVLKVLMEDIETGLRNWDDVLRLEAEDRSLPSGRLQDFPDGAPLTLHTLAATMIADSDNTATDMLIRLLGRDRIARSLGLGSMLTTRNFFQLKADPGLAERYSAGDAQMREAVVRDLEQRELPGIADVTGPHHSGVEWYVSVDRLCELALDVMDLDVFTINTGPVARENWSRVAFKGGSETGVLNLSAALGHVDDGTACISVSVNAEGPVDESAVSGLFARLARQLATQAP